MACAGWRAAAGGPVYIEKTGSVPATFPNRMVNGRKHGAWEEIFPNGTKFRGEYITGLPEGPATLRFPDGTRQTRNFKNDNPI